MRCLKTLRGIFFFLFMLGINNCGASAQETLPVFPIEDTASPGVTLPKEYHFDDKQGQGVLCGPHSLFGFLRIHGVKASLKEILAECQVSDKGASLAELQRVAAIHGVKTVAIKLSPDGLQRIPLPVIIHQETISSNQNDPSGHFSILTEHQGKGFFLGINSTTGGLATWNPSLLSRSFSGFALINDSPGPLNLSLVLIFVISLVAMGFLEWVIRSKKKAMAQG